MGSESYFNKALKLKKSKEELRSYRAGKSAGCVSPKHKSWRNGVKSQAESHTVTPGLYEMRQEAHWGLLAASLESGSVRDPVSRD